MMTYWRVALVSGYWCLFEATIWSTVWMPEPSSLHYRSCLWLKANSNSVLAMQGNHRVTEERCVWVQWFWTKIALKSRFIGKEVFRTREFLDMHFDNRHSEKLHTVRFSFDLRKYFPRLYLCALSSCSFTYDQRCHDYDTYTDLWLWTRLSWVWKY